MARPRKKFDLKRFLDEKQQAKALADYMEAQPELVEDMVKQEIKNIVSHQVSNVFYSSRPNLSIVKAKEKMSQNVIEYAKQLLSDPEYIESIYPTEELQEEVKKHTRRYFRNEFNLHQLLDDTVRTGFKEKVLAVFDTDPYTKKFYEDLRESLKKRIADTTVEKEVDRLMNRR
jgi:hydroxylamine reductase (hybrid-cluster protein)